MARLPNRQFGIGGGVAPVDPLAPKPRTMLEELDHVWDFTKDTAHASSVGRFGRAVETEAAGWRPATVGFNPAEHIPAGYEAEGEAFMGADGPDQIEIIRRQIDTNREVNKRRQSYGTGALLVGDLLAEATNPLNYLPVPGVAGEGFIAGAVKVGGANAITQAGQEAVLASDGTTSRNESLWNIGTAGAFGGVIGGAIGRVGMKNVTGAAKLTTRMPLPIDGAKVGSRFGPRQSVRTAQGMSSHDHKGVDLKAGAGTPIKAPLEGTVIKAAHNDGPNGNTVTIDHGNGVVTKYLHMTDFDVKVGQHVLANTKFGRVGSTGRSTGAHLHWQMEINGKAVDPLTARLPDAMHSVATPAHAVDASLGAVVPDVIDLPDGRAVPVAFGPTGTGAVASMRRARPTSEIVDEITGLGDIDTPTTRLAAADEVDVPPQAPAIEFDKLIDPSERFGVSGLPLSKTALLGMFDDKLREAEAIVKRGGTRYDPEWVAQQRALVETAYGEPDIRIAPDDEARLAAQRRAEAGPKAGRYAPPEPESGLDAVLTDPNAIRSKHLMAKAEGLYKWAKDGLRLHGTKEAYRPKPKFPEGHPEHKLARPYSKEYLTAQVERARAEMQRAEDALDEVAFRDTDSARLADDTIAETDEGLAEIRAQDRDKRAQDMDSGELADDLPFGRTHATDAGVGLDGDHIVFDMEAAIRSYSAKPWTNPHVEGVDPLPDDAFPTMKDWIDFVMLHEIEHSYNPQRAGESTAAYENRIVQRALEQARANKGSARVEGGVARLQTIKGTPIKEVLDLVQDGEALIHRSIQQLGSDGAMFLESNAAGGTPIAPGGSVFQRTHYWLREVYLAREAIRSGYLKYLGVGGDGGNRLGRELSVVGQRMPFYGAKSRGQMSLKEFRAEVGKAQNGFDDVLPEAVEAASVVNAGLVKMEAEARGLGLFAGQKESRIVAGRKRQRARQFERDADHLEQGGDHDSAFEYRSAAERLHADADAIEARSYDTPVMPYKEERYYPRKWVASKIDADRPRLQAILTEAYRRAGHANPDLAASNAIDLITIEPTGAYSHPAGSPNNLRHRDIPVTNKEVWDFIEQNPETVLNSYYRRMGSAVEMTRSFGDPHGLDEFDAIRLDLRRRGIPEDKAEKALQRWMDVRDRVAGGFHGAHPASMNNRVARGLRNFGSISALGSVAKSQIGDPLKAIVVQGLGARRLLDKNAPAGLIQGLSAFIHGDVHHFNIGGPAKLSGEAMELAMSRSAIHQIEDDVVLSIEHETKLERGLANMQSWFAAANLIAPITSIIKESVGMIAAHNVIKDAQLVAEGLHSGTLAKGHAAAVKRLGRNNIDLLDAQLLATMPVEMSERGLILPNIMAWEGEGGERARKLMLGSVNGEIRRSVVTPGPLERPRAFDGVIVTKGAMRRSFENMDAVERQVDSARDAVRALAGRPDTDPAKIAAQETLTELLGERFAARRNLGRNARTEIPLLSLPAQLHSFAMSSGAKTLHGLFGEGERNRVGGLLAMVIGGLVVARLKAQGNWDRMGWDERLMASVDNSGLTAIFGDVAKGIDAGLNLKLIPGNEHDPDDESMADEVGQFGGAAIGQAIKMTNLIAGMGDDDAELWKTMRQLPVFNIFYARWLMEAVGATFAPAREGEHQVEGRDFVRGEAPPTMDDPARPGARMLDPDAPLGATAAEYQPADLAVIGEPGTMPVAKGGDIDLDAYVQNLDPEVRAKIMARVKKKKPRTRHPRILQPTMAELL